MHNKLQFSLSHSVRISIATILVAGVASCGGGGGGNASGEQASGSGTSDQGGSSSQVASPLPVASPAVSAPVASNVPAIISTDPGSLLISEVASNYYSDDVAWFEVHNPGTVPIALSGYTLRASYISASSGESAFTPVEFALPEAVVPARGYLVVASKPYEQLRGNAQIVYVKNGALRPYWHASGSLELVTAGKTIDFVRFGTSTVAPLSSQGWNGIGVPSLPSGPDDHGKSVVRLTAGGHADTNTAADWTLVNFATPGGKNDVPAGITDSDKDGIPDSAKIAGGTYAGLDLYAMGARPGRRDIFIEIDYMKSTDSGIIPRQEALQKMVDAFAAKNIAVHIDAGALYSAGFNTQKFNLGGGNAIDFAKCIELTAAGSNPKAGCVSFYDFKSGNFDVRRKLIFHYAIFGNSLLPDGSAGPSGIAEMLGNDLIVTLGGYGYSTAYESSRNMLTNMQASTLMHEFGHNLGLRHGGDEETNYKPNHYSVMNYMYQFAGLSAAPNSPYAAERYYLANGLKGKTYCNLTENSPCTTSFLMSYSDGNGASLDENNLSESLNIGRGSIEGGYADWDDNAYLTTMGFARNINPQDGYSKSILRDYDEWANLQVSFSRGPNGSNSGLSISGKKTRLRPNPMNQHAREKVTEEPLPADLRNLIHSLKHGKH